MAGHSKWANIKHKKAAADAKKGKVFTKIIREITVAAKMGGSDLSSNSRLRLACEKALSNNMPKDNIDRAIKKGSGANDSSSFENITYEGYGIDGVAVMINCLTDNKIRTVADIRHIFSKNGGNLGTDGCVAYLFKKVGVIFFAPDSNQEEISEKAIENGAIDIINNDDNSLEILTDPKDLLSLKEFFDNESIKYELAEITMRPENEVQVQGLDGEKMQKIIDLLEDLDDVQEVYTNAIIE